MEFSRVDAPFREWAEMNGLHIYTRNRDYEIRSTYILDSNEKKWQVWLDLDRGRCKWKVLYSDNAGQKYEVYFAVEELRHVLQKIHDIIISNSLNKTIST